MELAWGIIMAGFTLFGMAALVVMSAKMTDAQKSDSVLQHTDDSEAMTREVRKAA